jgi:hypothetical protein
MFALSLVGRELQLVLFNLFSYFLFSLNRTSRETSKTMFLESTLHFPMRVVVFFLKGFIFPIVSYP